MSQPREKAEVSVTVRLKRSTYEKLERDRADNSRSGHIRDLIENPPFEPQPRKGLFPIKDHSAIAELFARMADARIPNNLNQLARAANTGSLHLTPETHKILLLTCLGVLEMRALFLKALGLKDRRK